MAFGANSLLGPVGRLARNQLGGGVQQPRVGQPGLGLGALNTQVAGGMPGGPQQSQGPEQGGNSWIQDMLSYLSGPLGPKQGKDWASNFSEFAFGKEAGPMRIQQYSDPQVAGIENLLQQGLQNSNFNNIEQSEKNRFNRETIPGIAERFQGMPGSNQNSSGLQSSLGAASAQLGERLGSLRSQYGLQQANLGLRPQFTTMQSPGSQGALGALAQYAPYLAALL